MRGGPSTYRKTNRAERAEQAVIVYDLRLAGHSYRAIEAITAAPDGPTGGERISSTTVGEMVREEAARRIDPKVDEWRSIHIERLEGELLRLDKLEARAKAVLERQHITVNNGRIISLEGEPLPDDGPVLAAIDRLIKIEDARRKNNAEQRKLLGIDAPTKVDAQVTEVTQQDLELQEMIRAAKAKVAAEEQRIAGGEGE